MSIIHLLLVFIPVSFAGETLGIDDSWIFIAACMAIIPLAVLISDSTEQIAIYTGPKMGGLLNATMGNVPELFIGLFGLQAGLHELVLASMAGSIIGNIMFVLGLSVFCGGVMHSTQTFDQTTARSNFSLLCFAAISLVVPLAFKLTQQDATRLDQGLTVLSFSIALILLIIYVLGLVFSLITQKNLFLDHDSDANGKAAKWSLRYALGVLTAASLLVAVESELLISKVEAAIQSLNLPELFIGIIIVPILGNVAEHTSAIVMAMRNKIDISVEIAIGSSMQIAMFVAPILVLVSFALGNPMIYLYDPFEVIAVITAILLSLYVFQDGKTYWLEGALLTFTYIVFCVAFFFK
jgi:Ca2+:H+ antiporter